MQRDSFRVEGGRRLNGEIIPQGAKNEALQILCAVMMTAEKVTVSNIPDILDIRKLLALLDGLGVQIERINDNTYTFQADDVNLAYLDSSDYQRDAQKIRGSVMLIGPILSPPGFGK